jgi:hypothetical protein
MVKEAFNYNALMGNSEKNGCDLLTSALKAMVKESFNCITLMENSEKKAIILVCQVNIGNRQTTFLLDKNALPFFPLL